LEYHLKSTPDEPLKYHPGYCKGVLFEVRGGTKRVELWPLFLINNEAPVSVFVTNAGRYVVTMDEWGRVGKLPVVVYGFQGELVHVHNTVSLGVGEDSEHIK